MVNIVQVKVNPEELKVNDKLEAIFDLNRRLLERLGEPLEVPIDTREGQRKVRELLWYTIEELFEAVNCLKNDREWVRTEYELDVWKIYDEIADALGFFVTVCRYLGLTPEKLYEIYLRKHKVNMFRLDSGY